MSGFKKFFPENFYQWETIYDMLGNCYIIRGDYGMEIYRGTICEHIREKYPGHMWIGGAMILFDDHIALFLMQSGWALYILGEEEVYKEYYHNMKDCDTIDHIIECPYKRVINYKNLKMDAILDGL